MKGKNKKSSFAIILTLSLLFIVAVAIVAALLITRNSEEKGGNMDVPVAEQEHLSNNVEEAGLPSLIHGAMAQRSDSFYFFSDTAYTVEVDGEKWSDVKEFLLANDVLKEYYDGKLAVKINQVIVEDGLLYLVPEYFISDDILIPTPYVTLHYPEQWSEYLSVTTYVDGVNGAVEVSAEIDDQTVMLFTVVFGESDGKQIGEVNAENGLIIPMSLLVNESAADTVEDGYKDAVYAMMEDINYMLEKLTF